MAHLTIMRRLTLLTAVPVIALTLLSALLIWNSYDRYKSAVHAERIMGVAVEAGNFIHPMQLDSMSSSLKDAVARFKV